MKGFLFLSAFFLLSFIVRRLEQEVDFFFALCYETKGFVFNVTSPGIEFMISALVAVQDLSFCMLMYEGHS